MYASNDAWSANSMTCTSNGSSASPSTVYALQQPSVVRAQQCEHLILVLDEEPLVAGRRP
jgi:hypothetical protein